MGEKLMDWIEKIVLGKKGRFLVAILIIIVVVGILLFPYIDANFLCYNRIEKRIDNLQKLVTLTGKTVDEDVGLMEEYQSILAEMENARDKAFATTKTDSKKDRLVKFIGGAIIWVIVAIVLPFSKKKGTKRTRKDFWNNVAGAILCLGIGSMLGYFSTLIPTLGIVEVNGVVIPIVQLIFLWLIMESPKKKAHANNISA